MPAASDVVELLDAPLRGGGAIEGTHARGAEAAVEHLVIADHDHFFGRRDAVDADGVELLLGANHDVVVNHDGIGRGLDHVTGPDRRATAA